MAKILSHIGGMTLRYHPILAFGIFYTIGLSLLLVCVAILGLFEHPAAIWLITSGYINAVPLIIVWFAAHKAALANGRPLFRYVGYDPKALRAQFRKYIVAFAVVFGLAAALVDLSSVALSAAVGLAEGFHYPFARLLLIAAVYATVAFFGIKDSFKHPIEAAGEPALTETRATPRPIHIDDKFGDR